MNTNKLYENNTYLTTCEAVVTGFSDEHMSEDGSEQMCRVLFDQTVFFPEGGGQSCDIGKASAETADPGEEHSWKVTDVQEKDGDVYHTLVGHAPLPSVGDKLVLTIDWEHRFDNMQRHLGEHILSGAFYRLFGAINKGFHMGEDYMTIDLGFDHDVQDRLGKPTRDGGDEDRGERPDRRRGDGAVAEDAPRPVGFAHGGGHSVESREDDVRMLRREAPERRERRAPAAAVEQRDAQLAFQFLHGAAQRRLRDEERLRRRRERAGPLDLRESAEQVGFDHGGGFYTKDRPAVHNQDAWIDANFQLDEAGAECVESAA